MADVRATVAEIQEDDVLANVLQESFDPAQFARNVMRKEAATSGAAEAAVVGSGYTEQTVQRIASRLGTVDSAIRRLVAKHQEELLHSAAATSALKASVHDVAQRAHHLRAVMDSVRARVLVPYAQVKADTEKLARVHAIACVLRRVRRLLVATQKLRSQIGQRSVAALDARELVKAASVLVEIEALVDAPMLNGVQAVDEERPWVHQMSRDIRARAKAVFFAAMDTLNQADLADTLQVFLELGSLSDIVDDAVNRAIVSVSRAVAEALDVSALSKAGSSTDGPPSGPTPGFIRARAPPSAQAAQSWKASLWERLHAAFVRLYRASVQLWNLERVLKKKRDSMSASGDAGGSTSVDPSKFLVLGRYWDSLTGQLAMQFAEACQNSPFLRNTLVEEYPRLRGMLLSTLERLQRGTEARGAPAAAPSRSSGAVAERSAFGTPAHRERLLAVIGSVLDVYLARSLARLNEPVTMMFSDREESDRKADVSMAAIPSAADIEAFCTAMSNEVLAVRTDAGLLEDVSKGIADVVSTFIAKAINAAQLSPAALTISSWQLNPSQAHNFQLVKRVDQVRRAVALLVSDENQAAGFDAQSLAVLQKALQPAVAAPMQCIWDICVRFHAALAYKLEATLLTLADDVLTTSSDRECSPCIARLTQQVKMAADKVLYHGLGTISGAMSAAIATRLITVFLRHVALMSGLSESAALAVAQDMAHLELVLEPLCTVSKLGLVYEELRAMRAALFVDPASLASGPTLAPVRPSLAMLFIISRGPAELRQPHSRMSMTAAAFIAWMDRSATGSMRPDQATLDGIALFPGNTATITLENAIWKEVRACVDEFAQRRSAVGRDPAEEPIYRFLDAGPQHITRFTERLRDAPHPLLPTRPAQVQ